MGFRYLDNITLDESIEKYMSKLPDFKSNMVCEEISTAVSVGRVTACPVFAVLSSPHYNACAMDGIALKSEKTFGATETTPVILKEGVDFHRVDTGDPLPPDADAVVMIEEVIDQGDGLVRISSAAPPWQHVRQIGEDICMNEMILPSFTVVEPAAAGAMLSCGVMSLKVLKKPIIGIIPTGDEIVPPSSSPLEGQVMEFNSTIFSSMIMQWDMDAKIYGIVPDTLSSIRKAIKTAVNECDAVIVNAGSSAGRDDFTSQAILECGSVIAHGIAIKPGKPTILGIVDGKPVIGVPGYPVSGIIVLDYVLKPILFHMAGKALKNESYTEAILSRKLVSTLKYREFVRVKLGMVSGKMVATPLNRGAGVVSSFVKADGILEIPINTEGLQAGTKVNIRLLKEKEAIIDTLVINGSHDPLIDALYDLMKKKNAKYSISSSHVGSMAGIMAIKRNEAHMAGIHLIDQASGLYNKPFIERYLPGEDIIRIKCVKRLQGLMLAPGNPYDVRGIKDMAEKGLRFVNRQKGSGTRVLLDLLLAGENINKDTIAGYTREEYTHMSVAALVSAGNADAGPGIYSAAKAYNLAFLPLCEEEYEFILRRQDLDLDVVQLLLETLKSIQFANILDEMGGYMTEGTGDIIL